MKDDWRIRDFTQWYVKSSYTVEQAAYLYYEANPYLDYSDFMKTEPRPSGIGMLNFIIQSEAGAKFYGGTPREYKGSVPLEVWDKIKEMYKSLLEAAKEGTLLTGNRNSRSISRDNLRRFFVEILGEKPKFLFPEKIDKLSIFSCPEGTAWKDITITLIANDAGRIKTPQWEKKFSYHKLGLDDKRKGDRPSVLWVLLTLFVKKGGIISSQNTEYDPALTDNASRLNKHLRDLFGIKERIYKGHYKKRRRYELSFTTINRIVKETDKDESPVDTPDLASNTPQY